MRRANRRIVLKEEEKETSSCYKTYSVHVSSYRYLCFAGNGAWVKSETVARENEKRQKRVEKKERQKERQKERKREREKDSEREG